jgi:hypothetical protein
VTQITRTRTVRPRSFEWSIAYTAVGGKVDHESLGRYAERHGRLLRAGGEIDDRDAARPTRVDRRATPGDRDRVIASFAHATGTSPNAGSRMNARASSSLASTIRARSPSTSTSTGSHPSRSGMRVVLLEAVEVEERQ